MKQIGRNNYLQQLIDRKENSLVKVITGIRRCGKSYLLFDIYGEYLLSQGIQSDHIIKLALDEDKNKVYRDIDNLTAYLESKIYNDSEMFYVMLDEVQFTITEEELKKKEPIRLYGMLNGLLHRKNVDVYVTGSNSKFLSSDIMTEFRGRGDEVRVYPLTFSEFLSGYEGEDKYAAFDEYCTYGGLPLILSKRSDAEKSKYLSDVLKNVYVKDIVEHNKLRSNMILDELIDVLASSIGSLSNPTNIANTFISHGIKTNDNTISNYIDYLIDAFLINKTKRYNIKGRKFIGSPFKYYFTDIGLRNAKLNFSQPEQTHIMENIIYNELLVRGYNVDVGIVEKRVVDSNGKQFNIQLEVDFVCNQGNKRYYIQSAFAIPDEEKMKQEQASLDRINDSYKKIIIVYNHCKMWRNNKGYLIMSIMDFLLNPNSLDL